MMKKLDFKQDNLWFAKVMSKIWLFANKNNPLLAIYTFFYWHLWTNVYQNVINLIFFVSSIFKIILEWNREFRHQNVVRRICSFLFTSKLNFVSNWKLEDCGVISLFQDEQKNLETWGQRLKKFSSWRVLHLIEDKSSEDVSL